MPADAREPLVEPHLVGRERGPVAVEEAGDDCLQPDDHELGLDADPIGEAGVGLELLGVPQGRVQADELADRGLDLADRAAAQLIARLHRRAVLEDEREPPVVVDGRVCAAGCVDRDLRREVLVEAELVAVAARRHELARGLVLRRELADDGARRAGYVAVEPEVVAGADPHQSGADGFGGRVDHGGIADQTGVAEHLGQKAGGDVAVSSEDGVGHAASGTGIRYSVAALVLRILRRTAGSIARSGSAARSRLSG